MPKTLGQPVVSALAVLALLVAAAVDPNLCLQFGVVLAIVLLTSLFIHRVNRLIKEPVESAEVQTIIALVESQKSKKELFSGQLANYWPAVSLVMAVAAVGISLRNQIDPSSGLSVFAAVLLMTYSQAISMTVPVAISVLLKNAADSGIIVRNRFALEKAAKLALVLFTKSGILTSSPYGVNAVRLASNSTIKDEHKLLTLAASVESMSQHAFALAIVNSAKKANLRITKPKSYLEIPGFGVQGVVGGSQVLVGSTALLIQRNIRMEVQELIYADESTNSGYSVVCVVVDGHLEGIFRFSHVLKPTATEAVYLVALDRKRVGIITGDSAGTAQHKANELKVAEVYAELSPSRKVAFVTAEKAKGTIGVIADATTDAELLESADVSIALLGHSTDLHQASDVLVMGDEPESAAKVVALSSRFRRKTNSGLVFAVSYGVLALSAFVAIGSPLQVAFAPSVAAVLGSLSVLFVSINAYSVGKLK